MTDKEKLRRAFSRLSRKQIHLAMKVARQELQARWQFDEALKEWKQEGFRGLANFMAGVTWALACRAALRESKGHTPVGGKRAQSGEMWLPRELLTAVRHQVKQRGWHPITSQNWDTVRQNLQGEAAAAGRPIPHSEDFNAVQFAVRMAAPTYAAVHISERALDDRFDKSGAV